MERSTGSIAKAEWRFVLFLAAVLIGITTVPLFYGWAVVPDNAHFTGIHFANISDWVVYYSYLEQAKQGELLFKDLFTAVPHQSTLNIFWLAVGLVARWFNLSSIVAFNLARVFLIPIFFLVAYRFIAYLFSDILRRKVALLLLSFSSGLGFLLIFRIVQYPNNAAHGQFNWPMDLWVPEAFTFLTLYYSPHFIASLTLMLLTFFFTARFVATKKIVHSFIAGLSSLVLFAFHPFHVITIFAVLFAYAAVLMLQARRIIWPVVRHLAIVLLCSLPSIGYYLYLLNVDWLTQVRAFQNLTPTTPLWLTLFGYGLLLPLAGSGWYYLVKEKKVSPEFTLVITWAVIQFFVIYVPVNYQRRLTEGLHVPLVILSTIGLFGLWHWLQIQSTRLTKHLFKFRYLILIFLTLSLVASNVLHLSLDFFIYSDRREIAYLDQDIVAAAGWLKQVDTDAVILNSAEAKHNIIPAYSGRAVYLGHGVETPNFLAKQLEVDWFFAQNRDAAVEQNFLKQRGIDYLWYGPIERKLGNYDPAGKPYLVAVYHNPSVTIYQVL